jgi:hypothetical protein
MHIHVHSRVPHDVIRVNCTRTVGGLLVYGLVFPKVGFHLRKRRRTHTTKGAPLGSHPGAHAQWHCGTVAVVTLS